MVGQGEGDVDDDEQDDENDEGHHDRFLARTLAFGVTALRGMVVHVDSVQVLGRG